MYIYAYSYVYTYIYIYISPTRSEATRHVRFQCSLLHDPSLTAFPFLSLSLIGSRLALCATWSHDHCSPCLPNSIRISSSVSPLTPYETKLLKTDALFWRRRISCRTPLLDVYFRNHPSFLALLPRIRTRIRCLSEFICINTAIATMSSAIIINR